VIAKKPLNTGVEVAVGASVDHQEMAFLLEPPCADDAYVNPGQGA